MSLHKLNERPDIKENKALALKYIQFENLLSALQKHDLTDKVIGSINSEVDSMNVFSGAEKGLKKQVRKAQYNIVKLVEKDLKLVTKNHYRKLWMALGMATFGVPFGVAFAAGIGNMAFIAIGLPIGMVIGIGIGTGMDKKALAEGRQIDVELKY
jgi:hypothetical protein